MDIKVFFLLALVLPFSYAYKKCECREVDGGFTEWTQFTPCDKSCGDGEQERFRYCANPYPQYGGKQCNGKTIETRPCKVKNCPQDGKWREYIGKCSKPCGGGKQTVYYKCNNPPPLYCGKDCEGSPPTREKSCNNHKCKECGKCKMAKNGICRKFCKYHDGTTKLELCKCDCGKCSKPNDKNICTAKCKYPDGRETKERCHCKPDEENCKSCLEDTASKDNGYLGHACRRPGLKSYCDNHKQSKNGGLPAYKWYWIHCSADGPWCKPCAVQTLVFSTRCDRCDYNAHGEC